MSFSRRVLAMVWWTRRAAKFWPTLTKRSANCVGKLRAAGIDKIQTIYTTIWIKVPIFRKRWHRETATSSLPKWPSIA